MDTISNQQSHSFLPFNTNTLGQRHRTHQWYLFLTLWTLHKNIIKFHKWHLGCYTAWLWILMTFHWGVFVSHLVIVTVCWKPHSCMSHRWTCLLAETHPSGHHDLHSINRACQPSGHHWDYYPDALSLMATRVTGPECCSIQIKGWLPSQTP